MTRPSCASLTHAVAAKGVSMAPASASSEQFTEGANDVREP